MTSDPQLVPIHVVGARGRMGSSIIRQIIQSTDFVLEGAVDRSGGPGLGLDAGRLVGLADVGVEVRATLDAEPGTVVVDFSMPEATPNNLERCVERGIPLVCGTTGGGEVLEQLLREAAAEIPVVYAANFSAGVTTLIALAGMAARALGPAWEAELFELHHRHKKDAPSGTALRIAHEVASSREQTCQRSSSRTARLDTAPDRAPRWVSSGFAVATPSASTRYAALRRGAPQLTHRATDRGTCARSAAPPLDPWEASGALRHARRARPARPDVTRQPGRIRGGNGAERRRTTGPHDAEACATMHACRTHRYRTSRSDCSVSARRSSQR